MPAKHLFILLILLGIGSLASGGEYFEILSSSEDEITVRFILPAWEKEEIERGGEIWDYLAGTDAAIKGEAGEPEIPFYTGNVGIPGDGDIQISILSSTPVIEHNIKLVPALEDYLEDDGISYRFLRKQSIYEQSANYPGTIVSKGYTAMSGDRRFYSFQVYPFQYNPAQRRLAIHEEIVIRLNILGSKERFRGQAAGSLLDKIGDNFLLNNDYSRAWREARNTDPNPRMRRGDTVNSYMLSIDKEGIYKVTYEYLTESLSDYVYPAAFSWDNINPRYLELRDKHGTVPVYFHGDADESFDPGDYFEFYADINHGETTWYDDYTSENILYLSLEEHLGSRMMIENGGLVESNTSNFTLPESFEQTVHIEQQNTMVPLGAQTEYDLYYFREDIWWWGEISAPQLRAFPFTLQYPHASNIRKASARICLFGLTYDGNDIYGTGIQNRHRAVVRINSALVDDIGSNAEWVGQREQIFENLAITGNPSPILNNYLNHGENQLSVSVPNLQNLYEKVLLDYLELTYWREYKTDTDEIKFHKPIKKPIGTPQPFGLFQFDLDGFSSEDVSIYKIGSSVMENYSVLSLSETGGAPYRISFQDSVFSNETEYLAVTESMKREPKSIKPDYPSNLRAAANGSEYVIITVREFSEGASQLAEFWESEVPGMNVEVVYVQDIFDEFNYGIRSAQAIKDFLEYAYNNWSPRPLHCLLLGEGLLDERDHSSYRWANKIPTKVVWFYARGATASDNWFGCLTGNDAVSDISISRLNITQASQISTIINKTQKYMTEPRYNDLWHSTITLSTGGKASEGNIFSLQSERIRNNSIPPEYRIKRVYCNVSGMPSQYSGNTTTLINAINNGSLYVQFMGHGASNQWDDYDLFDIYDVANLNNQNLFIASSMSCYGSAFFEGAGVSCIGEALTLDSQGAIAQIGFTGFGFLYQDEIYSRALLAALLHPDLKTIGEVIEYTKIRFYSELGTNPVTISLLHGSALLGDPRVEIRLPERSAEIELNKFNYAKGDSLLLRVAVDADIYGGRFYLFDETDSEVTPSEFYPFTYTAEDGEVFRATMIPGSDVLPGDTYNRYVKFIGYSDEREITGITNFTIGLPGAYNIDWQPLEPEPGEDIDIRAMFYDENGIDSVACHIKIYDSTTDPFNENGIYTSHYYREMVWDEAEKIYRLSSPITGLPYDYKVRFEFVITDSAGDQSITTHLPNENYFRVKGVKFRLTDFSVTSGDNCGRVKVSVFNNGNTASDECSLKLYTGGGQTLLDSIRIASLEVGKQRWEYLELPLLSGNYSFTVKINEEEEFSGTAQLSTGTYQIQMFEAGLTALSIISLDGNLEINFPAGFLPENSVFSLIRESGLEALNQPDIEEIMLTGGEYSPAYKIACLNSAVIVDTLGNLPTASRMEMIFHFGSDSRRSSTKRDASRYSVYRWNDDFQKWVFMVIGANAAEETISFLSKRTGIFSVFNNADQNAPSIDVNVEGQEFTYGGYVSQNGLISFLLGDNNGIDVIENELTFLIDGLPVEPEEYSINTAKGRLISVPVKYQMRSMPEGVHYLQMSCRDFNGNVFERELAFEVKADFDIIKIGNYPNPVKSLTINPINTGRTRFTYVLTDDADRVTIKIYTVSGRLVKTFADLPSSIGYHEYPPSNIGWDCRDEKGEYLANGVYFYKVIAKKGGKEIERIQKMAILK
jgi:hypothetical protein